MEKSIKSLQEEWLKTNKPTKIIKTQSNLYTYIDCFGKIHIVNTFTGCKSNEFWRVKYAQ